MVSHRSSLRRSTFTVATALAGALGLGGCGAFSAGPASETAAPSADAASQQPEPTATTDDTAMARYTAEQVRSAVASVESVGSPLELSSGSTPGVSHWDETVEPAHCEDPLRSEREFHGRHAGFIPMVSAVGDEGRLRVEAVVYPEVDLAETAGAHEETMIGGACRDREVTSLESGVTTRTTNTTFPVEMPEGATRVTAATSDMTMFDPTFSLDYRYSLVSAVLDNVRVIVRYGPPYPSDPGAQMDLESVPVQAERAAAERAARQVLTELTRSS